MSNQLAVLFPGIGYHIDKPLLYCSAKLYIAHAAATCSRCSIPLCRPV